GTWLEGLSGVSQRELITGYPQKSAQLLAHNGYVSSMSRKRKPVCTFFCTGFPACNCHFYG
ncbi:hypothetical protein K5D45_15210, partial [Pseudomonas cichorii]